MNRKVKINLIVLFVLINVDLSASGWGWTKIQRLINGKRSEASGFSINGKGYVCCGLDSNDVCYKDLWEYDPVLNVWSQKANVPGSIRRAAFAFELNNMGYVGGGIDNEIKSLGTLLSDFHMYNPTTNSWTTKSTLPFALFRSASATYNNKAFVFCGANSWAGTSNVYQYDPLTDSWSNISYFFGPPTSTGGREGGVATTINNKIYFGMGKDDVWYQKDWWEFDPITYSWTRKADFPASGRTGAFAFTLNNTAIVGMGSDGIYNNDTWQYNNITNSWAYVASFSGDGRRNPAYFVIGNVGFMGSGNSGTGNKQDFFRLDADVSSTEINTPVTFFTYYNPAEKELHISLKENNEESFSIALLNLEGKIILKQNIESSDFVINTANLFSGIYLATIINNNQFISTKKILIN